MEQPRSTELTVQADANGDLYVTFPQSVLEMLNWSEGDTMEWLIDSNGSVFIKRKA